MFKIHIGALSDILPICFPKYEKTKHYSVLDALFETREATPLGHFLKDRTETSSQYEHYEILQQKCILNILSILQTVYVESKEMTSTYFMHSKLCAHNKKNILSNWMFKSLISIVCFVYPCILMIKVVCHTKIISVSHLKHVITIKNMMLALIDLIWFFFVLFFRKRKKKWVFCKLNMTEPYFCYESVRNKIIC